MGQKFILREVSQEQYFLYLKNSLKKNQKQGMYVEKKECREEISSKIKRECLWLHGCVVTVWK